MGKKRFVILSGPSCVGKGPLVAAVKRFHPDLEYAAIPTIKSRESRPKGPRPDEVDVWKNPDYWRSQAELLAVAGDPSYLVGDCRGLPQGVDLRKVKAAEAGLLFVEIYHTLGARLVESRFLADIDVATVFLSPVSRQEIEDLQGAGVDLAEHLTHLMLRKQLVRGRYQGKRIDKAFIDDARGRAQDTISELRSACSFSQVIVNRDGEGSPNWHRLPGGVFTGSPEGDARRAVDALVHILAGSPAAQTENWSGLKL